MGLFDSSADYGEIGISELEKALTAGHGTDSANMAGGRALIPQDIEMTMVNALAQNIGDFKLMNVLKKTKATSTIHEYTRRNDSGDGDNVFVSEGGESTISDQEIERVVRPMKYMQTKREITLQMQTANTLENAKASEKIAGTMTLLKGLETTLFNGNSDAVPVQFDSVIKQVLANKERRNLIDMKGKKITDAGSEDLITEIARMVYDNGGSLTHSFMPTVIASDFQALVRDRLRFSTGDNRGSTVIETYPTTFSDDIIIAGKTAGPDKMFRMKGPVRANGNITKRPGKPSISLSARAKAVGDVGDGLPEGTYNYTVHAINEYGIGLASDAVSVALWSLQKIEITITPDATIGGSGFIICRSKINGTATAEMVRIPNTKGVNTVYNDVNEDIPGTGEILLLSINDYQASIQWDQFLPMMEFPLYPTNAAVLPFLMIIFGTPDVKVPWFHGVMKNVGYTGNKFA